jgi:hypothetical protein
VGTDITNQGPFNAAFSLTGTTEEGGNVIPLPNAAWSSLSLLGAIGGIAFIKGSWRMRRAGM